MTIEELCEKPKEGHPKGKKDQMPRKSRSDKGKTRGSYKKKLKLLFPFFLEICDNLKK